MCRGSVLRFTGDEADVDAAAHAVDGMVTLMENHTPLEEQTVRYCISLARGGEEKRLRELTDDFVAVTAKGRPIHPKTLGQKEYLAAIRSHAITFGVGPAGTGKTYLAVAMAVKAFKSTGCQPHYSDPPCGRSRRKAGLSARRPAEQGRPLSAPAV